MSWRIVEIDGQAQRVAVIRDGQRVWVGWPGGTTMVERSHAQAAGAAREGGVQAPLTGKVIKVEVSPGDTVEENQLLVVLEAMKMEYRLTAPRSGEVGAVKCEEGQLVDQGAVLVELEEQG